MHPIQFVGCIFDWNAPHLQALKECHQRRSLFFTVLIRSFSQIIKKRKTSSLDGAQ